jgi:hypothetical protein
MTLKRLRTTAICSLLGSLSGCGDGSAPAPPTMTPPAIAVTIEPQAQTIVEGQAASFEVVASSSATLSYQWQLNGSDIPGADAASYTTPPEAAGADGAQFQVRIANGSNFAIGGPVTLHVYSETATPVPTAYAIAPSATDSNIDDSYGTHYAYINSAVSPRGQLLLFFSGTGALPKYYLEFLSSAANNGFHVLGLAYPDSQTIGSLCATAGDLSCPGSVHEETLTGNDVSPYVVVEPANSIQNRLTKALAYLARQYPQQGWDSYLDAAGNIQWASIRATGHSQGGATAAYIGKQFSVARVCMLSAPDDENTSGQMAAWLTAAGQTDPSRYYGFAHMQDQIIPWAVYQMTWPALKMDTFGTYVNVDAASPPYDASHMLFTELTVALHGLLTYHDFPVVDGTTPLDSNGLPTYRKVWQYLCFL